MRYMLWTLALLAACGRSEPSEAPQTPQAPALASQSSALVQGRTAPQVVTGPKGQQVRLHGAFESSVVARRAADGSLVTECFDEAASAEAFMAAAAPSTAPELQ